MAIASVNPATEEVLERFEPMSDDALECSIASAVEGHRNLRALAIEERASRLRAAARRLEDQKDRYGRLLTEEMGKTLAAAVSEVEKCAWVCRFYADHGAEFLADRPVETDRAASYVRYLPIGPVLAVMPWNFPFWQVFRFAAPALMAGNSGLLKHASNVPRAALAIAEVFQAAGFPEGAFQTLLIGADKVPAVLADERVRAATLTGSEGAGTAVASLAGEHIKKTVLELGGSDPFIVMPSADLDHAVATAVTARTLNNGQSCIAAKRFIIHEQVYDTFRDLFVAEFEGLSVGDPMEEGTDIGPLALASVRDDLAEQVKASVAAGARRLTGARVIEGTGYFYEPGILEAPPPDSPAAREELFGPVASLFRVPDLDAAIALANASRFGLGSAIFTNEAAEAEQAINELEAGATFVNAMVASDPRLPFGGVKASGYGRELARVGMQEFMNAKTVAIANND